MVIGTENHIKVNIRLSEVTEDIGSLNNKSFIVLTWCSHIVLILQNIVNED